MSWWMILAAIGAVVVIYLLIMTISSLVVPKNGVYSRDSKYYRWLLYSGTWICNVGCRLKYDVTGMEKVPKDQRFLIVGNHRSNFDPIVTWWIFRKYDLAYISKESNFKIPWFGRIIRKCCFRSIDRNDPKSSMKTLIDVAELIKSDEVSVGIYPEGTRSKNCELLPFHNGVFKVAQMAKVPIVVVALKGTEKVHSNFPLKGTKISLKVLEVIPADEVKALKTSEIGERVRLELEENLR